MFCIDQVTLHTNCISLSNELLRIEDQSWVEGVGQVGGVGGLWGSNVFPQGSPLPGKVQ